MASAYRDKSRPDAWRVQLVTHTGRRIKIWLGKCTKTQAMKTAANLESLKIGRSINQPPPPEIQRWVDGLAARIRAILIDADLIENDVVRVPTTLAAFLEFHYGTLTDNKPRTISNKRSAGNHLIAEFGADRKLSTITAGDCSRFAKKLYADFATSHAGKLVGRFREFFAAAIADRALDANPWENIVARSSIDKSRERYIDADLVDRLIAAAPGPLWRSIIAFARYGGLRIPSEILSMKWTDIDWAGNRFTVRSQKTERYESGTRVVPIAPKLRAELDALWATVEPGVSSEWVCDRYRHENAGGVFRGQLLTIFTRASLIPWPKIWQNMRASCRTDWEAVHPSRVVDTWLGHSAKVGAKHYNRVPESEFHRAAGVDPNHNPEPETKGIQ